MLLLQWKLSCQFAVIWKESQLKLKDDRRLLEHSPPYSSRTERVDTGRKDIVSGSEIELDCREQY